MRRIVLLLCVLLGLAGCGTSPAASARSSAVTVLAASSLTEVFTLLGKDFEAANPGTHVTFSYGGSSTLAQQIVSGAPADVFAAASPATMSTVTKAGLGTGAPQVFARNRLVIAVPPGNPKGVAALADLAKPGVKVALCAAEVPCGAAAKTALAAAQVNLTPVTLGQDVKAALSTVELGEADAALVYRTDANSAAGKVTAVEFPESAKAVNDYPIVALAHAPNPNGAAAFVRFILSDPARKALVQAGFQAP
ncbi:MAG: molybdate ABC transporter substrate-binding protein [Actinobacteria bacterium 13_2_20CM_2_71_6]|nr:MAG: molybdate ABC transporter substrate-binding protein [Actinobacteria bacterium 13_2_20CM_2_71_6]